MSGSAANTGYLSYFYGHVPITHVPSTQYEETPRWRQFLIDQGAVEDSNMILPNLTYVKDYVWYASLNSCSDKQLKKWDCRNCKQVPNSKFISSFSNAVTGGHGYLAIDRKRKRIVCSFRGTTNTQNEIADLLLVRQPLEYANDTDVTVSTGFLSTLDSLDYTTPLGKLVNSKLYSDYKLAFIGHSLGGALASLALIKAQSKLNIDWKRLELYTYGQPRTGNSNFAKWYNRKPIASARVVNNTDPIPLAISTTVSDYRHHMNEVWIQGPPDNYKITICSNDQLEDPECSYKTSPLQYTRLDHSVYFGLAIADDCITD